MNLLRNHLVVQIININDPTAAHRTDARGGAVPAVPPGLQRVLQQAPLHPRRGRDGGRRHLLPPVSQPATSAVEELSGTQCYNARRGRDGGRRHLPACVRQPAPERRLVDLGRAQCYKRCSTHGAEEGQLDASALALCAGLSDSGPARRRDCGAAGHGAVLPGCWQALTKGAVWQALCPLRPTTHNCATALSALRQTVWRTQVTMSSMHAAVQRQ
jgi:hypothetical protein